MGIGARCGQRWSDELRDAFQSGGIERLGERGNCLVASLEQLPVGAVSLHGEAQVHGPSAAWAALDPAAAFEAIDEPYGAGVGQVQRAPQLIDAHVWVCCDCDERRRCRSSDPRDRLG